MPSLRPPRVSAPPADKYELYEKAVQAPEEEARRLAQMFKKATGRPLRRLREDFCGTAALATAFVRLAKENVAVGVDLASEPLAWARRRIDSLPAAVRARIRLVRGDVRSFRGPEADLVAALNFSWQAFTTRSVLHAYFRHAARRVVPGGLVVADVWGGSETQHTGSERRRLPGFTYVWERRSFDPITFRTEARIHFELRGGRTLKDAFAYRWRVWPLPDVVEAFEAAGLVDVAVLWEGTDRRTGGGNGVFRRVKKGEPCRSFIAYVVGRRR
jgi:SAM-dependent methyltransferase